MPTPYAQRPGLTRHPLFLTLCSFWLLSSFFLSLVFLSLPVQAAPQAIGLATDPANLSRLLWRNPDNSAALWNLAADGTPTPHAYPPAANWTPRAVAAAPGNTTRILWTRTDGAMSFWTVDAAGNPSYSHVYGPYSGYAATSLAVGGDGSTRILWTSTGGQFTLWTLSGVQAAPTSTAAYGPFSGWSPVSLAVGGDGKPRVLWSSTGGQMTVWTFDAAVSNPVSTAAYGPASGWTATRLACGADNQVRVEWDNTSGQSSYWTFGVSGALSYSPALGPPAGYVPSGIAAGGDGLVRLLWSDGQGDAQVWTVAADGTYTAKTYSAVPAAVPLYLSNLTLSSTTTTGGNGATGTVTLSSPAPAGGIKVALLSNNSSVTVPTTCTILANTSQTTFNVTTTTVSADATATISGSYNGWTQGDELSVLPSSLPPGLSFDVPPVHVAPGNGCTVVSWNRLPDDTVLGYNVYRTSGGTKLLLTSKPFASNFYPDTGLTNDTATYSYQVAAVDILGQEHTLSAAVSATPSSGAATLNWINPPSAVTDTLAMSLSLSSGGVTYGDSFLIDGVEIGGGGSQSHVVNGVQTNITGSSLDSLELSNGPHTVQFLGFVNSDQTAACVSPPITIQVSNTISSYSIDNDWLTPGQGQLCFVYATAPTGSTWTVQATSKDGATIIRTWQGASSLVKVAWDGKDASGNPLPPTADYALQLTVQPPGSSSQAATSPGVKSANPVPNAATPSKKTHPIKMLQGQPIALALISIGDSYYTDSSGTIISTPQADQALADVLTTAYTKLYGAGNFRVITSDSFEPDRVNRVAFVNGRKTNITDLDVLKGWLRTAQVFYLFGHGAGPLGLPSPNRISRSTEFGDYDMNHGYHLDFLPAVVTFDLRGDDVVVPTYVGGNNYVLAWIDSCDSAGGNLVTGQVGTPDYIWATAFNATTLIGNNGVNEVNNLMETSGWYKWRSDFWTNLAKPGETVSQAYVGCWKLYGGAVGNVNTSQYTFSYYMDQMKYDCTPGDGYGGNPRVVLYGDPFGTSLTPQ